MAQYRKKPVVIDAWLFDGSWSSAKPILAEANDDSLSWASGAGVDMMIIQTLEGTMTAAPGDYIIRGVAGEFYPCKPDIFAATYDEVA